jgi:hypothetical protein
MMGECRRPRECGRRENVDGSARPMNVRQRRKMLVVQMHNGDVVQLWRECTITFGSNGGASMYEGC